MFNLHFLCFLILVQTTLFCLSNNLFKRNLEIKSDVENKNVAEIVKKEYIDEYGNKKVREYEVKRSEVSSKRSKRDTENQIGCNRAKPPISGSISCWGTHTVKTCRAECIGFFKFPDGSNIKTYNCSFNGNTWSKIENLPDCEPAIPGLGCDIGSGENQSSICITTSEKQRCKAQCIEGHRYPDGSKEMEISCNKSEGKYDPIEKFPDCTYTGANDEEDISLPIILTE